MPACRNSLRCSKRRTGTWSASITVPFMSILPCDELHFCFCNAAAILEPSFSLTAPEEAAKLRRELDEANQARDKVQDTMRATKKELAGLVETKRNLGESIKT